MPVAPRMPTGIFTVFAIRKSLFLPCADELRRSLLVIYFLYHLAPAVYSTAGPFCTSTTHVAASAQGRISGSFTTVSAEGDQ